MEHSKTKQIFIVEDNELYSMMLDYILSKDTVYHFMSFKSGEECVQNLHLNPDLIILDYGLPGMNGYETLLAIKKYNPSIHVVILSSNTDQSLAVKLLKAGADDYILKQGHGETQIIEKIETILNRDTFQKIDAERNKIRTNMERMLYVLIIVAVLAVGFCILK